MPVQNNYMKRCIELALMGKGFVSPNPMVGCVIVYDCNIIGEGYHELFGGHHAEVNAIKSVKDQSLLKKASLYVNLEPCSHWGKTPPCSDLIIEKEIPHVVIGCVDSHSKVAGRGIERLKLAGINVEVNVLESECKELNKRFFAFHEKQRPYIILKWAETKDGFIDIAPQLKESVKGLWITNDLCRKIVHKWRADETAIMVGTNTAIIDNPSLTTRDWAGKSPIRFSIDKQLKFPSQLHLLDNTIKTYIFTNKSTQNLTNVEYITQKDISVYTMIDAMYNKGIESIIIEGGTKLLQSFIDQNLWDEARVFIGNKVFKEGIKAPRFDGILSKSEMIEETILNYYLK
jgi:diaminohydroxyphosphoribosylaminopyrimidine deaminase/5-amino-6-(5-phosphoribosylamino)uracil reductase